MYIQNVQLVRPFSLWKRLQINYVIAYVWNGVRESIGKDELQYRSDSAGDCLVVFNSWPNLSQLIASCHLKDKVTYDIHSMVSQRNNFMLNP